MANKGLKVPSNCEWVQAWMGGSWHLCQVAAYMC